MTDKTHDAEREALARKNFYGFFQQWWFSVVIMGLICITTLLPESIIQLLALKHDAILNGEVWRLFTSQFVHLGFNHTLLNLVGYLIISASFREDITPKEEMATLFISTIGVSLGIFFFNPEIEWYVGLSGAIYGLLTHYLIVGWKRSPMLSLFFGVYLIGKFYYEQFVSGPDTVSAEIIGGLVAIDSHLYGAITGIVTGLISLMIIHRTISSESSTPRAR